MARSCMKSGDPPSACRPRFDAYILSALYPMMMMMVTMMVMMMMMMSDIITPREHGFGPSIGLVG